MRAVIDDSEKLPTGPRKVIRRSGPHAAPGAGRAAALAAAPASTASSTSVEAEPPPASLGLWQRLQYGRRKTKNPSLMEVAEFASELANAIKAGISPAEAIETASRNFRLRRPKFAAALKRMARELGGGLSVQSVLPRYQDVLGEFFVEMSVVGAESGSLDENLKRVAENYRLRFKTASTIISALVQPAAVLTVGAGVVYIILTVTVPRFKDVYEALANDGSLPLATALLMWIGDFLVSWAGLAGAAAFVAGLVVLRKRSMAA